VPGAPFIAMSGTFAQSATRFSSNQPPSKLDAMLPNHSKDIQQMSKPQ
jgi:hypothetical protein